MADLERSIAKLEQALTRVVGAHAGEVLLAGRAGEYRPVDIRKARPSEMDVVDHADKQQAKLGYTPIGDLVCSRFGDVIVRAWAKPGSDTWATMLSGAMESRLELVTWFAGGASLTTSRAAKAEDDAARGLYRDAHPNATPLQLLRKHDARKAKLASTLGAPLPAPADLRAVAESIDRALVKYLGL